MNNSASHRQPPLGMSDGPWTINVANPSPYERGDYVETDLESLGVDPGLDESSLRLLRLHQDGQCAEIPFQIDRVLGQDMPKRMLNLYVGAHPLWS